ncbi:hypothetical protein BJ322DRAFT_1105409 [Thelephora terrestris]|uniref:Uncharacterized protein n=1 Tax=Thelephora terrestris TaxID=56493 RepID=A0A9P6HKR3_9AGAM|nr:hypothetical protein BJ322DRAFT_1105409 [Thelephora terrestris]
MPSICLGSSDEDVDCECVAFVPRKSRKSRCKECNHSLASHSDPPATQSHEHIAVAATQRDHNKYVDRLAKSLKASATHEKARKETLQGFCPTPSASSNAPSTKGKTTSRAVSSRVATQSKVKDSVAFGRIVFFPCGEQNLTRFTFPSINSTALEPWINAGLANEASKPGFSIRLSWGTKQMNAFLRLHFPTLFGYFDATTTGFQDIPDESDSTGLKRLSYQLPYILLKKNRKNYSLVDDTHPTADSYVDSMSSGKAKGVGFKAKTLYLVTRRRIPQEVIDEWFSPSQAPLIPVDSLKRRRSNSVSISSDSSDSPKDISTIDIDEDTEVDDVKVVEHPKKRARRMPLKAQDTIVPETPEFIEGSSRDNHRDVNTLALRLQHSASFKNEIDNPAWLSDEESELWNF